MNIDFTRDKYRQLLISLQTTGYDFITFAEYCKDEKPNRFVILRHDVDLLPYHSLATAKIEYELGIHAVYYFRAVPESWDEAVIKEIASLGHEVGYHYESLTTCMGNMEDAYEDFKKNLQDLRKLVTVETICMHGSPRSPFDSKDIWKHYEYKTLDIIGEPYMDADFSKMLYLTDTGRCWDGYKVSVRDKIPTFQDEWISKGWIFHSTDDIILASKDGILPSMIMITTHPQRWNKNLISWLSEYFMQNLKNAVKRILIKRNKQ